MSAARAFSNSLKELRIHLSQNTPSSKGLRDFIVKEYPGIKKANPGLPILIREANGVESRIIARFGNGRERKVVVEDMTAGDVQQKFNTLVSEAN